MDDNKLGKEVLDLVLAPSNTQFISVGGDRAAYVWDVSTGRIIRRFTGHDARVNAVGLNVDATVVVTGGYDTKIRFWDLR